MNLSTIIAPSFYSVHRDIQSHNHTHYWLPGGRGSTKSSFISIESILILLKNSKCHVVALRKVGTTLKRSVYAQIKWAINMLGLTNFFEYKLSPLEIRYKPTGQQIIFLGVDDPTKIKSTKMENGYVGCVWFEEANEFYGMEELRNINQSLLRGGQKAWLFFSYNPPKSRNNWVNEEVLIDLPDRLVSVTNYLTVPPEWLGDIFLKEAEMLKIKNETNYRHEYLGEVTGTGGAVFENVEDLKITTEMIENFDRLYDGLDFGFSIDALAYVKMYYNSKLETLYIFDEIYKTGLRNKQAAELIKPKLDGRRLACDSAEPKSIADFKSY